MLRTTIMLPEELKERAHRLASKLGISLGELIREALRDTLDETAHDLDPLYGDDVTYSGPAPASLAAEHDDHLYGERDR